MAAAGQQQRAVEMEADRIFEKYSVDEVRERVAMARKEIVSRKQDLRSYIGGHYRELVDVADAVLHLAEVSRTLNSQLSTASTEIGELSSKRTPQEGMPDRTDITPEEKMYALARMMKVVVDAPEKIAVALGSEDFLEVTETYFAANHARSFIVSSKDPTVISALATVPLVARQWESLEAVPRKTVAACWACAGADAVTPRECSAALCTAMLLEKLNPQSLLEKFLRVRLATSLGSLSKRPRDGSSAPDSLASFASGICLTLHLTDVIFCSQSQSQQQSQPTVVPCLLVGLARSFMSNAATPSDTLSVLRDAGIGHSVAAVPWSDVRTSCERWLQSVVSDSCAPISSLLGSVLLSSELGAAARALQARLSAPSDSSAVPSWRQVCLRVLGADFDVWGSLFDAPFTTRAKEIIARHFAGLVEELPRAVDSNLNRVEELPEEGDLGTWVWTPSQCAGSLRECVQRRSAVVQTPSVSAIVQFADDRLKFICDDVSSIVDIENDTAHVRRQQAPFSKNASELNARLRDAASATVETLAHLLTSRLSLATPRKVLFVGRLAHGLVLSTQLKKFSASDAPLVKVYTAAVTSWAVATSAELVASFTHDLSGEDWTDASGRKIAWETLATGESDDDSADLPTQTSSALWALLLSLSRAVVAASSHTLPRVALQLLFRLVSDGAAALYEEIASRPSLPMESLVQLWFDVGLIGDLFSSRTSPTTISNAGDRITQSLVAAVSQQGSGALDDRWGERIHGISARLESRLDPVDAEFYRPRLRVALSRCYSRNSVMLTYFNPSLALVLASPQTKSGRSSLSNTSSTAITEQHSILPLSKPAPRFGLLPTPSYPSTSSSSSTSPPLSTSAELNVSRRRSTSPQQQPYASQHERSASLGKRVFSFLNS